MTLRIFVRAFLIFFALVILVGGLYLALLTPSNNREWYPELAELPQVTIQGDLVSIAHERDWQLDINGTLTKKYIARTYNASELERVWFIVEPFNARGRFGHTFFSFDFKNEPPITVSVEGRKEVDEPVYSASRGLVRQYELMYVWATEEDAVGRVVQKLDRQFLMYPLAISKASAEKLFLELARRSEKTEAKPVFYNTLTDNCTSTLADVANSFKPGAVPWSFARIFTGHADDYLIELGYIPTESITRADITALARKTKASELSRTLRKHLLAP